MQLATLELPDRDVDLRRAAVSDLDQIIALLESDAVSQARDGASRPQEDYLEAFRAVDADPAQLLVVAGDPGAVIATMQLTFIPGLSRRGALRMQIEAVRVDASQQGGGLGSAMMRWALAEAGRRGANLVQLTSDAVRTDAHRFYLRLGFVASHVGFKYTL
jgi:GNAT superfamily N-acetyltransferase